MAFTPEQKREWAINKKKEDDIKFIKGIGFKIIEAENTIIKGEEMKIEAEFNFRQWERQRDLDKLKWNKINIDFSQWHWSNLFDSKTDYKIAEKGRTIYYGKPNDILHLFKMEE